MGYQNVITWRVFVRPSGIREGELKMLSGVMES